MSLDRSPKYRPSYLPKLSDILRYFFAIEPISADRSPKYRPNYQPKLSDILRYFFAIETISADMLYHFICINLFYEWRCMLGAKGRMNGGGVDCSHM